VQAIIVTVKPNIRICSGSVTGVYKFILKIMAIFKNSKVVSFVIDLLKINVMGIWPIAYSD
jgi:hypothetical protein